MENVIPLQVWEMHEFAWGTAVREHRTGRWTHVVLKPDGQQINVEHLNVVLHENGIEFLVIERGGT